jgi:mannose-6-phosphate isomerase-like protein (cupin superfamily)
MAPRYRRQTDRSDVRHQEAIHEGIGTITRLGFFREHSRLGVRFDIWELPPGATEGSHIHGQESPLEEIYYFLEGRGTMTIEGELVSVSAGDAVMVPPGVDHDLRNTGDTTLRLVLLWGRPRLS